MPNSLRNGNNLRNTGLFAVIGFPTLTKSTGLHIRCNVTPYTTPLVNSFDEVHYSLDSHVSYKRDIMVLN